MYSRILLALDASATSQHAAEHAIGLARALHASLRVICVVDAAGLTGTLVDLTRVMGDDARLLLDDWTNRAAQYGIDASSAIVETGPHATRIGDAIRAEAERWGAELLVLGSRGHSGVGNLLLGSVAEAVARDSRCAVLLVHRGDSPAH